MTRQRGYRYSTSTGGTLTGRGGELIILDDPLKPEDAQSEAKRDAAKNWFRNTVYTRLNSKLNGAIILVMQRLHIDDLAGHVRENGDWTILSLPAVAETPQLIELGEGRTHSRSIGEILHPEREPKAVLEQIRATIGSYNFSAQYQQEPVPPEGEVVKWSWFRMFETLPSGTRRVVQSWDIAIKPEERNNYTVCTTWAVVGENYYLLDLFRKRLEFAGLHTAVVDLSRRWRADTILIEDKVSGSALLQMLKAQPKVGVPSPIGITPKDDKVTRMVIATPLIEAGRVHLRANTDWLGELRKELVQFPSGQFDDQVDSISQFLNWVPTRRQSAVGFATIIGR